MFGFFFLCKIFQNHLDMSAFFQINTLRQHKLKSGAFNNFSL